MSAVVEGQVTEQPAKVRRKVVHLYWADELEVARAVGLAVVSICGGKVAKPFPVERQADIEVVGGLMPLTRETDCVNCARALESALARGEKAR